MIWLQVEHVALEKLERFELRHHLEQKLILFVFEEVDPLFDVSVGALNNLISELLRQIVEELVLLTDVIFRL